MELRWLEAVKPVWRLKYMGFCIPKTWQILKHFTGTFYKHKPLFSEEYIFRFPQESFYCLVIKSWWWNRPNRLAVPLQQGIEATGKADTTFVVVQFLKAAAVTAPPIVVTAAEEAWAAVCTGLLWQIDPCREADRGCVVERGRFPPGARSTPLPHQPKKARLLFFFHESPRKSSWPRKL